MKNDVLPYIRPNLSFKNYNLAISNSYNNGEFFYAKTLR